MWWLVLIGIAAVLVTITVIENRRGSKGAAGVEDRHLNAQDRRGGSGWGSGSSLGGGGSA